MPYCLINEFPEPRPRASAFQLSAFNFQLFSSAGRRRPTSLRAFSESRPRASAFQLSVFSFQLFPQNSHTLNAYFGTSIARFVYTPFSRLPLTISRFRIRLLRHPFVLLPPMRIVTKLHIQRAVDPGSMFIFSSFPITFHLPPLSGPTRRIAPSFFNVATYCFVTVIPFPSTFAKAGTVRDGLAAKTSKTTLRHPFVFRSVFRSVLLKNEFNEF